MRTVGICPACHKEIIMQAECPNCKFNIEIFEKAKRISIYLYNKGLNEYNNGYVLDSITTLEKSLHFYKNNIVARNLLGIIYYQIGEVALALKQWVISSNIKKEENPASKYLEEMNKEKSIMDKKNEAVKIYNEALSYAKQGNDDIAVIRLQKAISLSPEFLRAYLLLMLCYYKDDETKEKAKHYLEKARQIDKKSTLIKYYVKEITNEVQGKENESKSNKVKKDIYDLEDNSKSYIKVGTLKISKVCLSSIVTAIVTLLFAFYFNGFDKIAQNNFKLSELNKKYKEEVEITNEEIERLKQELESYKVEENKAQGESDMNKAIDRYNEKDYKGALELIENINIDLLSEELKNTYNSLHPNLMKEVARELYNDGKEKFEDENYDEAYDLLQKSLECASQESFSVETMYYIARIYEKKEDNKSAIEMYTRIINEFPNTHTAEQAAYRSDLLKD